MKSRGRNSFSDLNIPTSSTSSKLQRQGSQTSDSYDDESATSARPKVKGKKDKRDRKKLALELDSALEKFNAHVPYVKPFVKSFYVEHPSLTEMSEEEMLDYRQFLMVHLHSYKKLPRPIKTLRQAGFDHNINEELENCNFSIPTPVQAQLIPIVLSGYDAIAISQPGSGKTHAYVWPLVVHAVNQAHPLPYEGPTAVVVVPSRGAANRVAEYISQFGAVYKLRVSAIGGEPGSDDIDVGMKDAPEVIVSTPDCLIDLLHSREGTILARCSFAVFDDFHVLVDQLHCEFHIRTVVNHMRAGCRQVLMVGSELNGRLEAFAREVMNKDMVRVIVGPIEELHKTEQDPMKVVEEQAKLRTEKEDRVRKLMHRLMHVMVFQSQLKVHNRLLAAFLKWSREVPLFQRLEEVRKQLIERNQMMESVRNSYLRDVVAVKHYINKLNTVDLANPKSVADLQSTVQEVHSVPSVDLRDVIEKMRKNPQLRSSQMQNNMYEAGLLDPSTGKTVNPWEQSKSFRRLLRQRGAPSYQYPDAGGECVTLQAPSNYKLFIRYCQHCTGIMNLVRNWNEDIEVAFRHMADYNIIDSQVSEYKKLIASLTALVEEKEREVMRLNEKNSELEVANAWFDKWSYIKEANEREAIIREQKSSLSNIAGMTRADLESTAFNYALRIKDKVSSFDESIRDLKMKLKTERKEKDGLSKNRLELIADLKSAEIKLQNRNNDYDFLVCQRDEDKAKILAMEKELEYTNELSKTLQSALDTKEVQYGELREGSSQKIDSLNKRLSDLNAEIEAKEAEAAALREDIRAKKVLIANQTKEAATLKNKLQSVTAEVNTLLNPPPVKEKRKRNFKVISIVIRACIRFWRAAACKDYYDLGTYSYSHRLESEESLVRLEGEVKDLGGEVNTLSKDNHKLSKHVEELTNDVRVLEGKLNRSRLTEQALSAALAERDATLKELREGIANGDYDTGAINDQYTQFYHKTILQLGHNVTHGKITAQFQRSLANHLSETIFQVRSIIYAFDIEAQIRSMNNKGGRNTISLRDSVVDSFDLEQSEMVMQGLAAAATEAQNAVKSQGRPYDLSDLFWKKAKSLTSWLKINKSSKGMQPFQLPVSLNEVLFSEEGVVRARGLFVEQVLSEKKVAENKQLTAFQEAKEQEAKKRFKKVVNMFVNPETRSVSHRDMMAVQKARKQATDDIHRVERYILFLRNKHTEAEMRIKELERKAEEFEIYRQKMEQASVVSEKVRPNLATIKASFSGMLESNDVTGYLANIVAAIENVQKGVDVTNTADSDNNSVGRSARGGGKKVRIKRGDSNYSARSRSSMAPRMEKLVSFSENEELQHQQEEERELREEKRRLSLNKGEEVIGGGGGGKSFSSAVSGMTGTTGVSSRDDSPVISSNPDSRLSSFNVAATAVERDEEEEEPEPVALTSAAVAAVASAAAAAVGSPKMTSKASPPHSSVSHSVARSDSRDKDAAQHHQQPSAGREVSAPVVDHKTVPVDSAAAPPAAGHPPMDSETSAVDAAPSVTSLPLEGSTAASEGANSQGSKSTMARREAKVINRGSGGSAYVNKWDQQVGGGGAAGGQEGGGGKNYETISDAMERSAASRREAAAAAAAAAKKQHQLQAQPSAGSIGSSEMMPLPSDDDRYQVTIPSDDKIRSPSQLIFDDSIISPSNATMTATAIADREDLTPSQMLQQQQQQLDNTDNLSGYDEEEGDELSEYDEDEFDAEEEAAAEADRQYLRELEVAKLEAMAMLRRDREQQEKAAELQAVATTLATKSNDFSREVRELRISNAQLTKENADVVNDLNHMTEIYQRLTRQNELLREVVEEGYRYHHDEVDKLFSDRRAAERERERLLLDNRVDQSTQINCSVCTIRETLLDFNQHQQPHLNQHHQQTHHRHGSPNGGHGRGGGDPDLKVFGVIDTRARHINRYGEGGAASDSVNYDEDTVPTVNEPLNEALGGGNVVLMARPRRHTSSGAEGVGAAAAAAAGGGGGGKRPLSPTLMQLPVSSAVGRGGTRPLSAINATTSTTVGGGNNNNNGNNGGYEAAPRRSLQHSQSASAALLTNNTRPVSAAAAYLTHSNSAGLGLSETGEQSKFSKMKKIPARSSSGAAAGNNGNGGGGSDSVARTLSNTAAFLQNKILEEEKQKQARGYNNRLTNFP